VISTKNSILGIAGECSFTVVSPNHQAPMLSCFSVLNFQKLPDGATAIILPCAFHLVVLLTGMVLALRQARESHWRTITITTIFLLVTTLVALVLLGTSCSWGII
jgi:predicted permease